MRVIGRGIVGGIAREDRFQSKTFPAFEVLPSGRWLAACRVAEKKTDSKHKQVLMTWSDDQGRTWVPVFEPVVLPDIQGIPGQAQSTYFLALGGNSVLMVINWVDASRPDLPYYDPVDESLKDTRIFYSCSEDGGESWSSPLLMDTTSLGGPVPLTGPPIRLGDGSILCQFEINKYKGDSSKWIHRSAMIRSEDDGKTWGNPVLVTAIPDMYYWDQRPNVLNDGLSIINFFWTLDGKKNEYVNIHQSLSEDGGRTWSLPKDTGIYGQPGRPVQLEDGRIATIEINRVAAPAITVRIKPAINQLFEDALEIFKAKLPGQDSRYINMNDAWDEMAKFSVGHPNLLYLGGKEILAYFYQGDNCDETEIAYCMLSLE